MIKITLKKYNMEKSEILKLINELGSDSKSKSKKASDKLVEIFEPKIKAWAEIVAEYLNDNISEYGDYLSSRGSIVSVSYYKTGNELTFYYKDSCLSELIEDWIHVDADDIIDDNFINKVKKETINQAISRDTSLLMSYEKKITELREKIDNLKTLNAAENFEE